QCHCAGRTEKLERLREGNADLSDGHVIKDMRQRNAADGGNDQDEIHLRSCVERSANFSKCKCERKQQRRSDETDDSETADRPKPRRWAFNQNAVKRPAKCGGKGNE